MRHFASLVAFCLSASALGAQNGASAFDTAVMRSAIELGTHAKHTSDMGYKYQIKAIAIGVMGMWGEDIEVTVRGPEARIAAAASEAAHRYRSFTAESVTATMIAPFVEIRAQPQPPVGKPTQPLTGVAHLVLQTRDRQHTVQPVHVDTLIQHWTAEGGSQDLKGLVALFPLDSIPDDDFDIVVLLSNEKEHRQKVGDKERQKILHVE